ncbi:HAD family hydrolase [Methylovirgula sp. 4M-Z18]|uniref:HAD family hydrolase n=1 Tax=Methylovirgula sp. 4M-Z18 TaxID=2293567 RepID=UPI000E2ED04F|nr:HAD family hydrolase [Methylovirgula sp. 4M-Z18]RFB76532.1 HAD family hydrolase [Methylovirgula sp. 4M-Z18]
MANLDLTIFDCDGVLIDSEMIGVQVEAALLSEAGYSISAVELSERFSGMTWRNILCAVEKETGLSLVDALLDKTETILDTRLAREVEAIDGVASVLSQLPYKRCVCSNTRLSRLDVMLTKTRLKSYFAPHIFSAKELGDDRSKPKPDIFLHGARQMGVAPAQTVVIEDSTAGVEGARAAGMRVIGFTGGGHTYPAHASRLTEAGAQKTIAHMRELPAAIVALAADR